MKMIRFAGPVMHRCNSVGNPVSYGAAPVKRNTGMIYWFDNVMRGQMATPWEPSGSHFEVTCKVRFTSFNARVDWFIYSVANNIGIGVNAAQAIQGRLNTGSTVTINPPLTAVIDSTYEAIMHAEPGNNWVEMGLQRSAVNTGTAVVAGNNVRYIGGLSDTSAINGYMKDVRLIDIDDPANSVYFPMDEGAGNIFYAYDSAGVVKKTQFDATIVNFNAANWISYVLPAQQPVLP